MDPSMPIANAFRCCSWCSTASARFPHFFVERIASHKMSRLARICAYGSAIAITMASCQKTPREAAPGALTTTREPLAKDPSLPAPLPSAASKKNSGAEEPPLAAEMTHYFPESASRSQRRPLIVFLHGLGASGRMAFDVLKLDRLGREQQVYVVAPDGSVDSAGRRYWNAHRACCDFEKRGIDHVAYLDRLITATVRDHHVDDEKVFVWGFSNGGFMAHRLACELGDRLAGVVSAAGAGPDTDHSCRGPHRVRVLEIHGDADQTVRYEGGTLFGRADATYGSALDTLANWAKRLECQSPPTRGKPMDLLPGTDGKETEALYYSKCRSGAAGLWTVRRGTHLLATTYSMVENAWRYLNEEARGGGADSGKISPRP